MAILNEVYVGRLPEIDQMVTDIHNIREEYRAKGNISVLKTTKIFEKHVEEMWGFKAFLFDIYISSTPNAYTMCAGSCIDCHIETAIECTSKGYRFSKKSNISAITKIATSLLADNDLSDEEILAIILHEVGHSFAERADQVNVTMDAARRSYLLSQIFNIFISILLLNPFYLKQTIDNIFKSFSTINTISTKIEKIIKSVPGLRHLQMAGKSMTTFIEEKIDNWLTMMGRNSYTDETLKATEKAKKKAEKNVEKNKLDSNTAFARSLERLSDDFANMYGFGTQLATGLIKMGSPYKYGVLADNKVTDLQKKIDSAVMDLYAAIDAHPGNCDRVLAMIDALEQDYKTLKVDSRIKEQMRKDIDALKNIADDLKKSQKLLNDYNNKYMKASAKKQMQKGNTETKKEKLYNDRKQVNKDWEKNKIDID
jgi:hypothetical protein